LATKTYEKMAGQNKEVPTPKEIPTKEGSFVPHLQSRPV